MLDESVGKSFNESVAEDVDFEFIDDSIGSSAGELHEALLISLNDLNDLETMA